MDAGATHVSRRFSGRPGSERARRRGSARRAPDHSCSRTRGACGSAAVPIRPSQARRPSTIGDASGEIYCTANAAFATLLRWNRGAAAVPAAGQIVEFVRSTDHSLLCQRCSPIVPRARSRLFRPGGKNEVPSAADLPCASQGGVPLLRGQSGRCASSLPASTTAPRRMDACRVDGARDSCAAEIGTRSVVAEYRGRPAGAVCCGAAGPPLIKPRSSSPWRDARVTLSPEGDPCSMRTRCFAAMVGSLAARRRSAGELAEFVRRVELRALR
jgi:hypothetical protein